MIDPKQLSIFSNGNSTYDLFPEKKWPHSQVLKIFNEIVELWSTLKQQIRSENVPVHTKNFRKLCQKLRLVFGNYVTKILDRSIMEDEYLSFMTLMTWAGAVAFYKDNGNFNFFREVPIFPFNEDFGAGRIDAFSVRGIGKEIVSSQR